MRKDPGGSGGLLTRKHVPSRRQCPKTKAAAGGRPGTAPGAENLLDLAASSRYASIGCMARIDSKRTARWVGLAALLVLAAGCKREPSQGPGDAGAAAATASAARPLAAPPKPPAKLPKPLIDFRPPQGPAFPVLAGKGLGPVRLGATRATVERQMGAACEQATDEVCRYVERGVELFFEGGKVVKIHIHRTGRPAEGVDDAGVPRTYGTFNGAIPPDLRLFMLPSAIEEELGKAKRVFKHGEAGVGAQNLVEEHHYPVMVLEYDRLPNGKLGLGGIRIPS